MKFLIQCNNVIILFKITIHCNELNPCHPTTDSKDFLSIKLQRSYIIISQILRAHRKYLERFEIFFLHLHDKFCINSA